MIIIYRNFVTSKSKSLKDFSSIIQDSKENYIEDNVQLDIPLRPEILQSWKRSKEFGVNPFQKRVDKNVNIAELDASRERNNKLLSFARKDISHFLQTIGDKETIITVSDNNGLLIDAYGDNYIKKKAEKINFLPGALWSEEIAGTNAIGTAINNKQPIQILFSEHFSEGWKDWFCAAAPILHPLTNELLGVLDFSGKWKNINSHTLGLVMSKANQLTKHIEGLFYVDGLQINPFLRTLFNNYEHGVMLLNENKQVLKVNDKLTTILQDVQIGKRLEHYPAVEKLVDYIILNKHEVIVEKEISIGHEFYVCSVQPVVLDESMMVGIYVYFRKSQYTYEKKQDKQLPKLNHIDSVQSSKYTFDNMIGSSKEFHQIKEKAKKAAKLNTTLFLHGETGTGKEMFAQSIHHYSERGEKTFIAINCGAIPSELIESELFGYEAGAFTGANPKGSPGKFELANGGTIFLDEIGDMPLNVQVHLLRVLEERVVTRIGGRTPIPVDVRVIAATHRNLTEAVKKGTFREDLLYRLRVIQLNLPSLRERSADIPELVYYYVNQLSSKFGKSCIEVDSQAMEVLQSYPWPGNIRELRNVLEQALFNMDGNIVLPNDLPAELIDFRKNLDDDEKEQIVKAIESAEGNITKAAVQLGISRATMYRKIKKYRI